MNLTGQNFTTFIDPEKRHDIYKMIVVGFNNVWVSAFYVLGVGLLCLHLSHGLSSIFQTLGINHPRYTPKIKALAMVQRLMLKTGERAEG